MLCKSRVAEPEAELAKKESEAEKEDQLKKKGKKGLLKSKQAELEAELKKKEADQELAE